MVALPLLTGAQDEEALLILPCRRTLTTHSILPKLMGLRVLSGAWDKEALRSLPCSCTLTNPWFRQQSMAALLLLTGRRWCVNLAKDG